MLRIRRSSFFAPSALYRGTALPDWLITGCSELLTLRGPVPRRGRGLSELGLIRDGAILVHGDRIAAIGPRRRIERHKDARRAEKLDLGGRVVLPGFVDAHTHLVFPESRASEYEQRNSGKSYEEIARAGGGIRSTVKRTRSASAKTLKDRARANLREFARHGTTTLEAKSGYGLDWKSEVKILDVLEELHQEEPLDIVRTFLGAHVVPPEFHSRPDKYVDLLVKKWIPTVATAGLAEFCDVYCDRGAFTLAQSRRILAAGRACGLVPRIHAEQLARTGAARLAVECKPPAPITLKKSITRTFARSRSRMSYAFCCQAAAFIWAARVCSGARTDHRGRDCRSGYGLQSRHQPDAQHAHDPFTGLRADAHDARRSNSGRDYQSSVLAAPARSRRLARSWKICRPGRIRRRRYREIPYYFGMNLCSLTMKRGAIVHSKKR